MNVNPTNISTALDTSISRSGATDQELRPKLTLQKEVSQSDENAGSQLAPEDVEEIVEALNDNMDELQTSLGFQLDEDIDEMIVTVMNRDTREIVRQIPAQELVTIREKMAELTGILLNKTI